MSSATRIHHELFRPQLPAAALPYRRPLLTRGLIGVHADRHRPNYWPEHEHPHVEIAVFFDCVRFGLCWRARGNRQVERTVTAGDAVFIRENIRHSGWLRYSADIATLFLAPGYLDELDLATHADVTVVSLVELIRRAPVLAHLAQDIGNVCRTAGAVDQEYVTSLGHVFGVHLLYAERMMRGVAVQSVAGLDADVLQRIVLHIQDHLGRKLTVEELAEQARLTRGHFIERFKQSTGLPPHRYLVRERVLKALRLLLTTRMKLIDVGEECGFADQTHFAKCFFDMLGYLPSDVAAGRTSGLSSRLMRRISEAAR